MGDEGNLSTSDHQLWVNLSALSDGNIFSALPELLKNMFNECVMDDLSEDDENSIEVVLPSDDEWQTKIYYQLVEKQRLADADEEDMMFGTDQPEPIKLHDWNIIQKPKNVVCDTSIALFGNNNRRIGPGPITWTISDIAKAGSLLSVPPVNIDFEDEQEMRRVYTLIYDVYRYKNILTVALENVSFYDAFPMLLQNAAHVWLLFYDLYHRNFKKRETDAMEQASHLFNKVGLAFPENALWTQRIKLAASVARLRIKHNALSLSELLPSHLKDVKVTEKTKYVPVTCWINSNKVSDPAALCKQIESTFHLKLVDHLNDLKMNTYRHDRHCPQVVAFHSSMRAVLAKSDLIRQHILIFQDKSFCVGPATFDKLVNELELGGCVIQSHINSPRSTAYLATLLSHNERIKKLLAFNAGQRKNEYECYFETLGMSNIDIFSDRLIDTPPNVDYMEEVVAVYATPPNSYSAVSDPIDLVCSRGGDLSMLEVLTECEDTAESRERVANILEEQRKTLKFAMSRPQIQFVLYETHSEIEAENERMVKRSLNDINKIAKFHHANLQGKIQVNPSESIQTGVVKEINNNEKVSRKEPDRSNPADCLENITNEINNNESEVAEKNSVLFTTSSNSIHSEVSKEIVSENLTTTSSKPVLITKLLSLTECEKELLRKVKVPDSDIFDCEKLPPLCANDINCICPKKDGCYLALLQRKKITRLDNKYMIHMAENRGVFGTQTSKTKVGKLSKKKLQEPAKKTKNKKKHIEIDRIAAPTQAFLRHTIYCPQVHSCPRCNNLDDNKAENMQYKRWWTETTRHIIDLKANLRKQKSTSTKLNADVHKSLINVCLRNNPNVDEIAAKANELSRIPLFPRLRLPRYSHASKIPVHMTTLTIPPS